jgi:hypothetical protein
VFVERFNRTLKEIIYRYFTEHHTDEYLNVLPKFIENYNNTIHSRTKQKPIDIYLHDKKPYEKPEDITEEDDKYYKAKYKVGDYVRISKVKKTFEKGYTSRWSKEVYKIKSIDTSQRPYTYELEDLKNETIKGNFYTEELQKTDLKDFAVVEKVLKTKKVNGVKMYFVQYDGYGPEFNEWLNEKQLNDLS